MPRESENIFAIDFPSQFKYDELYIVGSLIIQIEPGPLLRILVVNPVVILPFRQSFDLNGIQTGVEI